MPIVIRLLVIAIVSLTSAPLLADPKADAQEHIERARQHFAAGRDREAVSELETAYRIDPTPNLLYALGTALSRLGRCEEAAGYYARFLETKPAERQSVQAREAMAACKPAEASEPKPEPTPPPKPEPPPEPPPPPPPPAVRPWYSLKLGWALVGAGAAAGVASGLFYLSSNSDLDDSKLAPTYDASQELLDDAKRKRLYTGIAGAGALVLVAGGVGYFLFADRGTEYAAVSIVPARSGAAITWTGRF